MISFHANHVSAKRKDWGNFVIWSVDKDLTSELYLMLQGKHRVTDQDVRFGMDDIYIETCGQGWSWYGNIEHFELTRTRVFVQLSREAANRMSNDGRVETIFSLDDVAYEHLRKMLARIFEGKGYYHDRTV